MKHFRKSFLFVVLSVTTGAFAPLQARIGESRGILEGRLLNAGGIIYRDGEAEENRQKGMPYVNFLPYMEGAVEVFIYFKTDDGRKPKSSEIDSKRMIPGWDLHVVYVRGKSAIEVYKRSQGISEYEMNELLARQAGGAYWQRKEKPKEGEEALPSAFGFDLVRSDGAVRAKRLGADTILIVDAEVDHGLANLKESDLIGKAPISTEGF